MRLRVTFDQLPRDTGGGLNPITVLPLRGNVSILVRGNVALSPTRHREGR